MIKKILLGAIGLFIIAGAGYALNLHLFFFGLNPTLNQLNIESDLPMGQQPKYMKYEKYGSGNENLILIAGIGMTGEVFESFVELNKEKYSMYVVSLLGFGGELLPAKPADFDDYYQTIYIDHNVNAIKQLIQEEKIKEPTLVGYFMGATQVVLKSALLHPELISRAVVVSGEVRRYPFNEDKRRTWINELTNNFFKYVDRDQWNKGKFLKEDWSLNEQVAHEYYNIDEDDPLPVLIQYTIESNAYDLTYFIDSLKIPLLAVTPDFTASQDDDQMTKFKAHGFVNEWKTLAEKHELINFQNIKGVKLAILEDKPSELTVMLDSFISKTKD